MSAAREEFYSGTFFPEEQQLKYSHRFKAETSPIGKQNADRIGAG